MTRQESHLFCRIAVHNKLVSLEDANACLREALKEGKSVAELFVARGLLSVEQARKIFKAVKRHTAGGAQQSREAVQEARPAREVPVRRGREKRRRPVSQAQLVLSIVSIGVLVIVLIVFVILWQQPASRTGVQPAPEKPQGSAPSAQPEVTALSPKGKTGTATTPKAPPALTPEEKDYIESALNQALGDARQSLAERIGQGVASLDNFVRKYGDRITSQQRKRIEEERQRLVRQIKRRFEKDKGKLLEAKQKGETEEVQRLYNDIRYYAEGEPETMKELDSLLGGEAK